MLVVVILYAKALFSNLVIYVTGIGPIALDRLAQWIFRRYRNWAAAHGRFRRAVVITILAGGVLWVGFGAFWDEYNAYHAANSELVKARSERDEARRQLASTSGSDQQHKIEQLEAALNASRWAPLTGEQIVALRSNLKSVQTQHLWIACETVNCKDLAESLGQAFDGPGWETEIHKWGGMDVTGTDGIAIEPNDETARGIRDAIEMSSRLRVTIRDVTREQFGGIQTLLIVGTKPF